MRFPVIVISVRDLGEGLIKHWLNEPAHEMLSFIAHATSEGPDETAYVRSLVRAFAARIHNARM